MAPRRASSFRAGGATGAASFQDEDSLVELVHWYTDGTPNSRLDRASPKYDDAAKGSRLHGALSPASVR